MTLEHLYREREDGRPIHRAACPCWRFADDQAPGNDGVLLGLRALLPPSHPDALFPRRRPATFWARLWGAWS